MQLSIIIINFNTNQLTFNCITSIKSHLKGVEYEIILVDNSPKNEDNKIYFQSAFPNLIYLLSPSNIGFGRANNLGIQKATGKYLLLLNSDTVIFDDSLQKTIDFMEMPESGNIGLLGCKLLNADRTYQNSFFPFIRNTLWNYLIANNPVFYKIFNVGKLYQENNNLRLVGDVSGAFMLLRRDVIEKTGAFDPDFFLYCEETEWCRERISQKYDIVYYPLASIIHLGGKSAPQELMYIQSRLSLSLLWYKKGWFHYVGYIIITIFNLLTTVMLAPFVTTYRRVIGKEVRSFLHILPYLFSDILRYGSSPGSREIPLIYKGARNIYFGQDQT